MYSLFITSAILNSSVMLFGINYGSDRTHKAEQLSPRMPHKAAFKYLYNNSSFNLPSVFHSQNTAKTFV